MKTVSANLQASEWIVEYLLAQGVRHFIISPGSRSTPLTVAVARNQLAKTHTHFDERGAGFLALGIGKATQIPAALICTSGSAVANYFPAVVEASMDNIPLIVLSADRPPELIDVGANQAIFQENIFGIYPRSFLNLDPPGPDTTQRDLLTQLDQAIPLTNGLRPGPVHVNCQFREPFLCDAPTVDEQIEYPAIQPSHEQDPAPADLEIDPKIMRQIDRWVHEAKRGLVIVGRGLGEDQEALILSWATQAGFPIFPDVQSSLRYEIHANIVNHFDLGLLAKTILDEKPDLVVHFGGAFTSKRLLNFLDDGQIKYISIKPTPERIDPNHQVDHSLVTSAQRFCASVSPDHSGGITDWLKAWQGIEGKLSPFISARFQQNSILNDPAISNRLSSLIPAQHALLLGNSMAIRDMEMFAESKVDAQRVLGNRGTSGIDGLLATAVGIGTGDGCPVTVLVGDLAFLHDLNSLALLGSSQYPVIIIVLNNFGGGIFSFLPIKDEQDVFEPFFETPHAIKFKAAAKLFSVSYTNPIDLNQFSKAYQQATTSGSSWIIELNTRRETNHTFHLEIFEEIRNLLAD